MATRTLLPLLLASLLPAAQETASETKGRLTLEDVFTLGPRILRPVVAAQPLGWLPDGQSYLQFESQEQGQGRIVAVEALSEKKTPLFLPERMEAALAALPGITAGQAREWSRRKSYTFSEDKSAVLLNEAGDLIAWRFDAGAAARLTHDPKEEVGETFSPDGKLVAFVSDYNLHLVPAAGGTPRALTTGGNENRLMGRLDWVYQEEVYGRGNFQAYWWAPDSTRIAFLELDESPVGSFPVVDHLPLMQEVEHWRYPKAGAPNPKAELHVVDVAGGPPRRMDLTPYRSDEFLIVRVGWTPDGKEVVFQVQDRIQTWLDVCAADPATGKVRRLFRETTGAWVEPTEAPFWRKDGKEFYWLSERDGFKHLYRYDREGKLLGRLTEGAWEVTAVHGIAEDPGHVYFNGNRDDVKGSQLFRVRLDGSGLEALTKEPGTRTVNPSPTCDFFAATLSSLALPGRLDLLAADGSHLRTLAECDNKPLTQFQLSTPELHQVPTRDGFTMEAMLIKPPGFDPARKYPVLCHIYGGPHAPQVRDRFGGRNQLWHQLVAQEGYLVWICDNRSASGKGLAATRSCYKRFGQGELLDLEDGLDWLLAQGFADPARIGIWGWSYGGYMTAYALTHSKRFKIGISGAPVTDWSLYDSIYTERYMDTPQRNPEGYAKGSVLKAAGNLTGRLLLIHGTIDENVHMQNTLLFAEALQQAGKQFQLMLYPKNRHAVVNPGQAKHMYRMMTDFVLEHL